MLRDIMVFTIRPHRNPDGESAQVMEPRTAECAGFAQSGVTAQLPKRLPKGIGADPLALFAQEECLGPRIRTMPIAVCSIVFQRLTGCVVAGDPARLAELGIPDRNETRFDIVAIQVHDLAAAHAGHR